MPAGPSSKLLAAAARLRRLPTDERGNVLIYVSVTGAVLLGMVGLALDGSRAMITHSEAQAAADAAALAGASQLDGQSGACARAQAEAAVVANQQRLASGGPANITIASGSPRCLSGLPTSDSTAIGSGLVTTSDSASRYVQVTTQQLTHQNTLLNAVSSQNTVTIQRTAVAGFRRSLCAAAPVMMICDTLSWTPGVAFDAWDSNGGSKGFISTCGNSANCVANTLASTQPSFCVTDTTDPASGNKTNKAADGVNVRFGQGSRSDPPSDLDVVDFTAKSPVAPKKSYSNDINGGTGWNCLQYWADNHATDGLAKPTGCTATATSPTTRYSVYQAERAAGKIPLAGQPPSGIPTTTAERRLLYIAILDCSTSGSPEAYLKAFMIGPAAGSSSKTIYVEPIGLVTSKTDPTVLHEEVQLYR